MAKKLKSYYNTQCARNWAEKIQSIWPAFKAEAFVSEVQKNIRGKEFMARQDVFVEAFDKYLSTSYLKNLRMFGQVLGPELQTTAGMFTYGWWLWPAGRYVQKHGCNALEPSLDFIYALTKRFTGEFAIRPLLEQNPKKVLRVMKAWSKDPNVHVRRLASEGLRISLPWAKKNTIALEYFEPVSKILTQLKSDPEKFVQKSVGNNINDLMKADPIKANQLIDQWKRQNPTKETLWIIKHGTRSLRKKSKHHSSNK